MHVAPAARAQRLVVFSGVTSLMGAAETEASSSCWQRLGTCLVCRKGGRGNLGLPRLSASRASTGSFSAAGIASAPCSAPTSPPTMAAFVSVSPPWLRISRSAVSYEDRSLRCLCACEGGIYVLGFTGFTASEAPGGIF